MPEKEPKVKSITKFYYLNPKIQEAIFNFSKDREVVPSYMMEHFGKRPDSLQYPADIVGLVNNGATSLHCSEELWNDPLKISSDMSSEELSEIRKSWDLLIDIDSPFLDYSKIAARLIVNEFEAHGVKNYGIKFSGKKGFHLIVPGKSFPESFEGKETRKMFPEWPRAICQYILAKIRPIYNKEVSNLEINFKALQERTNLTKEDVTQTTCPNCGKEAEKSVLAIYECPECEAHLEKPNAKLTKRKLKCTNDRCSGYFEIVEKKDHFFCANCKTNSFDKKYLSDKKITYTREAKQAYSQDFEEQVSAEKIASLDLVLVAPRHLFRMPYSLHEKTALVSLPISKDQIANFEPRDASPMNVKVIDYYPPVVKGEAESLLKSALDWKKQFDTQEESDIKKKYANYEPITLTGVTEEVFPAPIKKLLKGLKEGKKRGLFILLTFLRSLNFSPEFINTRVREWNKLNEPPLKEGYVKSQIDWHLRQKKKILPPNYSNNNFYKDLNLLDSAPKEKNPVSEVVKRMRNNS